MCDIYSHADCPKGKLNFEDERTMLPENLISLHEGEEFLRQKSAELIEKDADLAMHLRMIERSMDQFNYFVTKYKAKDDDQLTIQLLGVRLFNAGASSIKLAFSGYYQASAAVLRDILEVNFLLGYFQLDRTKISEWRNADSATRRKKFSPVKIRTALDEHDGFVQKRREKAYQALSEIAAHASYSGFQMLTPIPGKDAHCGPFFEEQRFRSVLEEHAKLQHQVAAVFRLFFDMKRKLDCLTMTETLQAQSDWSERFVGYPIYPEDIAKMRRFAQQLPD